MFTHNLEHRLLIQRPYRKEVVLSHIRQSLNEKKFVHLEGTRV